MSTSRIIDITTSADIVQDIAWNFGELERDVYTWSPSLENGAPTTTVGPPTAGSYESGDLWMDALGARWRCISGGTPGTWIQVTPAPVTADPNSGTVPIGYLVWNTADGAIKRHAGSYDWQILMGGSTAQKIGFHGATPTPQRSGAAQAAVSYTSQTISDPPTQAEVQAIHDGLVAAVALLNELRAALVEKGLIKGSA